MVQPKSILDQLASQAGLDPIAGPGRAESLPGGQPAAGLDLQNLISGRGGLAAGALAGGLAGLLLGGKKPRKLAKSALKVGGVALVGGLAYKAWRDWQDNKLPQRAPAPARGDSPLAGAPLPAEMNAPADSPFMPAEPQAQDDLTRALIRAMIAAAKADGHVCDDERRRITDQLGALRLNAADMAFIDEELSGPLDIDAVANGARCPEQAAEIYAASLLVADPDGPAEKGYLAMLAARLRLDEGLVAHLHASVDSVAEPGR